MRLPDYQDEIEQRLESFAQKIGSEVDRVQWYTEFHSSRRYRLAGNLVFMLADSRERELAVVGVELDDSAGWTFDAIGRASVVMAQSSVPADSPTVLTALSEFLDQAEPLIAASLRNA